MTVSSFLSSTSVRAATWENRFFAYAKTKTQISFAVTAKLISAFVFATRIVQSLSFLNTKFQASSHFLRRRSLICVGPGRKPRRPVFWRRGSVTLWWFNLPFNLAITVFKQLFYEPQRQKTGLPGFRPGVTQTGLGNHWRWLEIWNFGLGKKRDCTIRVAKTKALISFAVTA